MPLPYVEDMSVSEETMTTMRVRWSKAEGATGYLVLYKALNATQPGVEEEVRDPSCIQYCIWCSTFYKALSASQPGRTKR